jgi:hypothetical protein
MFFGSLNKQFRRPGNFIGKYPGPMPLNFAAPLLV